MPGSSPAPGTTYFWHVQAVYGSCYSGAWSGAWNFTTAAGLYAPALALPSNGATGLPASLTLSWGTVGGALTYGVQVSTASSFASTIESLAGLTAPSTPLGGLGNDVTCFWRADAANAGNASPWSTAWSFTVVARSVIPIAIGWNMKSLNIYPADSTAAGIFSGFSGFLLVKSRTARSTAQRPDRQNIGTLHTGQGYQIYANSADTIRCRGTAVNLAAAPISFSALNWNIAAYLPQSNMPVVTALASIAGQLIIAKDNNGLVYAPGVGVNQIDTMRVGEGYFAVTSASASLTYPLALRSSGARAPPTLLSPPPPATIPCM